MKKLRHSEDKSFVMVMQLVSCRDRTQTLTFWPHSSGSGLFCVYSLQWLPYSWEKLPLGLHDGLGDLSPITSMTSPSTTFSLAHLAALASLLFLKHPWLFPILETFTLASPSPWDISPQTLAWFIPSAPLGLSPNVTLFSYWKCPLLNIFLIYLDLILTN